MPDKEALARRVKTTFGYSPCYGGLSSWARVSIRSYLIQLDDLGNDWLRVRATIVNGQVLEFTVHYETTIRGVGYPVARYDTAHGFPHQDVYHRAGVQIVKRLLDRAIPLHQAFT